mgnify:CR=1 FL=1
MLRAMLFCNFDKFFYQEQKKVFAEGKGFAGSYIKTVSKGSSCSEKRGVRSGGCARIEDILSCTSLNTAE